MATPYTEIYDFFLSKVTDYSFIDESIYATQEELEKELNKYLRSAIVRFKESKTSLERDVENNQFIQDLSDEEKEILSLYMIQLYLTPKILSTEKMESRLTDRDYREYSQAKQLEQMRQLKKDMQLELSQLVSVYSYSSGLSGLN